MSIMSRVLTNIQANQAAMRVICRAGEIAQKMRLSSVVPHTLFLALYEKARQDVVIALKTGGVDCVQYCKKVADEINAMPKVESCSTPQFHPILSAILNRAYAVAQRRDSPVATKGELQCIEADAMVQVGLASDIEPITNMMVKLALVELARGTNSGISALADELTFDYYMWANRRERRHRNWSPFPNGGNRPTILRWYGANIEKAVDCALCGAAGIALDDGADIEAQLVDLNCD